MRQGLCLLDQNYPRVASDLLRPLIGLLSAAREACSDDLDKLLILLIIMIRTAEHPSFERLRPEQLTNGEVLVFPTLGTNARSISDSTGMPRETVRRKVADLIAMGWITRVGTDLQFTVDGFRALTPLREGVKAVAGRYSEVVLGLIAGARQADLRASPSGTGRRRRSGG